VADDKLLRDLLAVHKSSSGGLVHVEVASLGDHEDEAKLVGGLHDHWEVAWGIRSQSDLAHGLELLLAGGWGANFGDDQLLSSLTSLTLAEAEKLSFGGAWRITDWHLGEAGSVSLKWHGHRALDTVELDVGEDVPVGVTVEADQVAPLLGGVHVVAHDLAVRHLRKTVEYLHGLSAEAGRDVEVVDGGSADNSQLG